MEEKKERNKFLSVKFWVAVWAVLMITFIVITKEVEFKSVAEWLCAVPLAYIGANVYQKKIYRDGEKTDGV